MARIKQDGDRLTLRCPGCGTFHQVDRGWTFNGDFERPTLSPSILARWESEGRSTKVCHSFVVDGQIQFLNDCTHSRAGETIDLPEVA